MMSVPGKFYLPDLIMHAGALFSLSTVTVSAESVRGSTPGVRVTWNTTVPPECVATVTVEFRTSSRGPVVVTYTTTNTSQTELIQTGLQCATNYYISVVVTGDGLHLTLSSRQVQVLVGGREIVWFYLQLNLIRWWLSCTDLPVPSGVRAEVTADNTSIRVSWKWSCQNVPDLLRVDYQPEGGSRIMHTVDNTAATSATLPNLLCNTIYTIWVHYVQNGMGTSVSRMVYLPARGMY